MLPDIAASATIAREIFQGKIMKWHLGGISFALWLYTEVQIGATIYRDLPLWEMAKTLNICRLIMTLSSNFLSVIKKGSMANPHPVLDMLYTGNSEMKYFTS